MKCWSPYYRKCILELEEVQKRFTTLIPGLRNLEYNNRFEKKALSTQENRHKRGDLIETYKTIHGIENIEFSKFFSNKILIA